MADKKGAKPSHDGNKPLNKSATYAELANTTGLTRKQVVAFFDALEGLIAKQLGKKGPGVFVLPGLLKLKKVVKPATKGGMKPNPFKPGEMMEVKPKPARTLVKPVAMKGLKNLVA
jgi:Bacterial DNA-binding protein